jgi:hypothetical protein
MPNEAERRPPTWAVVLVAIFLPLVIAIVFLTVFHWFADQPMSAAQYQADPNMGQKISDRNDFLVHVHAFAQLAFVVIGAWLMPGRTRDRVIFLVIAVPVSVLVFVVSYISLLAG